MTEQIRLGDVVVIAARLVDPRLAHYRALPLVNGENVESGTGRLLYRRTAAEEGVTSPKYLFRPGDILYSKLRPYLRKVTLSDDDGLCSADMYPLTPDTGMVDPQWLVWLLLSDRFTRYAVDQSARARMPKVNQEQLLAFEFILPDLRNQRPMAARLSAQMSAARRAISAVQRAIQASEDLIEGALRWSLSGPVRDVVLRSNLDEVVRGIGPSWARYPVFGSTRGGLAIAREPVGKHPERYKLVEPGTVFYNPMRILIGSISYLGQGQPAGITSPDYVVMRTKPDVIDDRWFYEWLRSWRGAALIQSLARGAVRERMLFRRLAAAHVAIPSIERQREASAFITRASALQAALTRERAETTALPNALLRDAFAGAIT